MQIFKSGLLFKLAVAGLVFSTGAAQAELSGGVKKLDRNGDGQVSLDEYNNDIPKTLKNIDKNKDKVLELEEVKAYYLTIADESDPKTAKRIEGVMSADADGDGKVTVDELKARNQAAFTKLDKNGDGVLSDAD